MKQVNFSHPGGFPLEQETLERLQTAYRQELFEALKGHLGIKTNKNYTVTPATNDKKGWAIIHQEEKDPKDETGAKILEGILYPIEKGTPTGFLKTTRTGTNLTYGTGESQTAYFDYEAKYITQNEYTNRPTSPPITDALAIHYYDLNDPAFIAIKDIQAIEADIDLINETYLPLNGSKAMEGDLDLGSYKLSKLDVKESATADVRVSDFRLGSALGRALVNNNTNLSLNYASDWQNTNIGGKVYLENLNTSDSTSSLLVLDDSNQVIKNNTLIKSLVDRIVKLEEQPVAAIPIGMIAIWGKTAPFPKGWEEYVPLRGRMPVGFDSIDSDFSTIKGYGGYKNKELTIDEMPGHDHESIEWTTGKAVNDAGKGTTAVSGHLSTYGGPQEGKINMTSKIGGGQPFSLLNPYRVVHFIEYTGRPIAPNPVFLTNGSVGRTYVDLVWTPSTDSKNITNYLIYKDDTLVATIDSITPFYSVGGLSRSSSYSFYVVTKDVAGNLSVPSNILRVKTDLL
jgi:hypothetical protein